MADQLFHRAHYNIIAARIRENVKTIYNPEDRDRILIWNGAMVTLAMDFAGYFEAHSDRFDPIRFLNACSPDPDSMPFAELWEKRDV